MSEKIKDLTAEQAKGIQDTNKLVAEAIKNWALNKAEGEEIINRLKLEKDKVILNDREQLLDIAKKWWWTWLAKVIEAKTEARVSVTIPAKPTEAPKSEEKPTEAPAKPTEAPKQEVKPTEAPVKPTEAPAKFSETLTSTDIQKSIDAINKIIWDGIQSWEEEDLTSLVKYLQDKKILKQIPWIKDWKLQKWQDLIDLWRWVISRLEKVKTWLIQEESEDVEKKRLAEEKTRTEAENKAINEAEKKRLAEEKLAREKQEFLDGVSKLEIWSTDINKYIDEKISSYEKTLDTREDKIDFKEKILPEMKKLKVSESDKTFDNLTTWKKLEDKKLTFNIDPSGFDSYDSKKSYSVNISDFKADNSDTIKKAVLEAYKSQIDTKVKELLK